MNVKQTNANDVITDDRRFRLVVLVIVLSIFEGLQDVVKSELKLLPGMPAEVLISTGDRTLLEYLIDPFSNLVARSFIED